MTTWAELGLPAPLIAGYQYRRDSGIVRTPFAAPMAEVARVRLGGLRAYELAWGLDGAQLALAETFLKAFGYTWFEVCMASGLSATPVPHEIRLTSDWQTTALSGDAYRLAASAEARLATTAAVTPDCGTCS